MAMPTDRARSHSPKSIVPLPLESTTLKSPRRFPKAALIIGNLSITAFQLRGLGLPLSISPPAPGAPHHARRASTTRRSSSEKRLTVRSKRCCSSAESEAELSPACRAASREAPSPREGCLPYTSTLS